MMTYPQYQTYKKSWPYVVIALLLIPSFLWIKHDFSVWPWDPAAYGETSVDLWFLLITHPSGWWEAMIRAFGAKAPGIAWVGQFFVPLGQSFGSIEFGLLLSILVAQFGTLTLIYKTAQKLTPHQKIIPWVSVLCIAAAPLFIAMSHIYFVEPFQLFTITYFFWIAANSPAWKRAKIFGHLLIAMGLAMAVKVTSPIYCFFPGILVFYDMIIKQGKETPFELRNRWKDILIVVIGSVICSIVFIWYWHNYPTLRDFIALTSSGKVALNYGTKDTFIHKLWYWLKATQQSIASPLALKILFICALSGIVMAFIKLNKERQVHFYRFDALALSAAFHVIVVLSLFSLNINEENRYLLPLLPSIALIFMWCLSCIPNNQGLIVGGIAAAVFLLQGIFIHLQAHNYIAPLRNISYWVKPLNKDQEAKDEVQAISILTCPLRSADLNNIVGVELPWLNANTLSFYSAKARLLTGIRCYYSFLGYAEKDVKKAWKFFRSYNPAYYISTNQAAYSKDFDILNEVSRPIFKKVKSDPTFKKLPFDSKFNVVIFQNRKRLS